MFPYGHYADEYYAAIIASSITKSPVEDFMVFTSAARPIQTEDPEALEEKIKSTFSMFKKNGN